MNRAQVFYKGGIVAYFFFLYAELFADKLFYSFLNITMLKTFLMVPRFEARDSIEAVLVIQ